VTKRKSDSQPVGSKEMPKDGGSYVQLADGTYIPNPDAEVHLTLPNPGKSAAANAALLAAREAAAPAAADPSATPGA
jgi:hypothetical protein